jgi:hypothetical protein
VEDRRGPDLGKSPRQGVPREAHASPRVKRQRSERSRDWLRLLDPAPAWLAARHARRRAGVMPTTKRLRFSISAWP